MTGYTVHTGSTEKFTEGWDNIFSGKKNTGKKTGKKKPAKSASADKGKKKKPGSKS